MLDGAAGGIEFDLWDVGDVSDGFLGVGHWPFGSGCGGGDDGADPCRAVLPGAEVSFLRCLREAEAVPLHTIFLSVYMSAFAYDLVQAARA